MTTGGNAWTPQRMGLRLRLDEVDWTPDDTPAWLEGRSDRSIVASRNTDGTTCEWTQIHSVRGGVGYGGGDFCFDKQSLFYAERSGTLWRQGVQDWDLSPLFPKSGAVASPTPSPDRNWLVCVHSIDGRDVLKICDVHRNHAPTDIIQGADFYMQPSWHPDSTRLAWIEWDHPQMPWDGSRLCIGEIASTSAPKLVSYQVLDGGPNSPVLQPVFSPDGKYLAWIGTDSNHHYLRVLDLATQTTTDLWESPALLPPAWIQGVRVFSWSHDSRIIWLIAPENGEGEILEIALHGAKRHLNCGNFKWFSQIRASPYSCKFVVLASSPQIPDQVAVWENDQWDTIISSDPTVSAQDCFPKSNPIIWENSEGIPIHGILHEPPNTPNGACLPLLVSVHGGPTAQKTLQFSAETAFFTSRGWRVLDVNYRGSTGYGEEYRTSINGNWGIVDVADCKSGAQAMIDRGLAKSQWLVIKGGSAGGYTVLRSLIEHPGFYRAGISNYGVTDLLQLVATTHKFEARYLDRLIAPLPEGEELYKALSPITNVSKISDALAIFQGTEDRVVPLSQAKVLVDSLLQSGTPHLFRIFEGEGHGWRQNSTIIDYYQTIEDYLNSLIVN